MAEKTGQEIVTAKKPEDNKKGKRANKKSRPTIKKGKKRFDRKSTSVVPSDNANSTPVNRFSTTVDEVQKSTVPTPVRPEVEYQEKSTAEIKPSHKPLPLSTPVRRTDGFVDVDNSVDGFLSIKH